MKRTSNTKGKQVIEPIHYCSSCNHCKEEYCKVFKRPIKTDYNRCFYHSFYQKDLKEYKTPKHLKEDVQTETLERLKKQREWYKEQEKIMKDIA